MKSTLGLFLGLVMYSSAHYVQAPQHGYSTPQHGYPVIPDTELFFQAAQPPSFNDVTIIEPKTNSLIR
jgi:hypothetical protein